MEGYQDIVVGRNAVTELLKSDKDINKIFVQRGEKYGSINQILNLAKNKKVVVVTNLKPVKLCGVESNGMILASGDKDVVKILSVDNSDIVENGSNIH